MIEGSKAVVIRTRQMSETSLIVHWLTEDLGRISTVARGAQRAKSPFRGKLDLLHECEMLMRRSRSSDLHTLNEVRFLRSWPRIRSDLALLRQASCAIRWIEMQTETDTPIPELFGLFTGMLDFLDQHGTPRLPLLVFEIQFLDLLGLSPGGEDARLNPVASMLYGQIQAADWKDLQTVLVPAPTSLGEIAKFLDRFLPHHLGRMPQGRAAALDEQG